MRDLKGIYAALVTPMKSDESVDYATLARLVNYHRSSGLEGLYLCGSTGEGFLLSDSERRKVVETVADELSGQMPLIVHTGTFTTAQTIGLARHAKNCGADAISAVPPFYYRYTPAEIVRYYLDVVEATQVPMIIYNIPVFTGVSLTNTNAQELFEHPGVVGIKYTSKDIYGLERLVALNPNLLIFNGHEETYLPALSLGVDSMIGSTANFMVKNLIRIRDLFQCGQISEAAKLQHSINKMIDVMANVGIFNAVKYATKLHGIECGACRRPFQPLNTDQKHELELLFKNIAYTGDFGQ